MPRPLIPPRGIHTGTRWLFDSDLAAGIKETLLQLMALTWGSPSRATPPLSYHQLEAMTKKDARTLRGHFSALRAYHAALRLQRAGAGQFIVVLAEWLFTNTAEIEGSESGKNLPQLDLIKEEEEDFETLDESLHLPPLHDHPAAKPGAQKAAPEPARPAISKAMHKRLLEAGVFPGLIPEVGRLVDKWQYSERELQALLEWCKDEQPDRPAGLFVGRARAGGRAPAIYHTPPCPRCGQRGKHSPDCPSRYALP